MRVDYGPYLQGLSRYEGLFNFWCSVEYWEKAGWRLIELGEGVCGIGDSDGLCLPPVGLSGVLPQESWESYGIGEVWALFPGMEGSEFLDWNLFYRPQDFLSMKGKRWMKFRKNARKFPRRWSGGALEYRRLERGEAEDQLVTLLYQWSERFPALYGEDELVNFVLYGENREALFGGEALLGINVWDFGLRPGEVNYRYLLVREEPFLDEYMRLEFYLRRAEEGVVLVNDGGVLDNEGLLKFKLTLNPVEKRRIYQWVRR